MSSHVSQSPALDEEIPTQKRNRPISLLPSSFQLLSRNLRLLNLDQEPDWPGLSEDTFAIREDGRTRSKLRYRTAGWLFHKLFAKWDLQLSRTNLDAFFPSLEPLQSIKLRSTVFVLLEELKRDGTLPRGCFLRKSMLEDCVGPKFEELLLSFSTVVLQKQMRLSHVRSDSAFNLATAQELGESDIGPLSPLSLSLQSSLTKRLSGKRLLRDHCNALQSETVVRDEYFKLLEDCNNSSLSQYSSALREYGLDRDDLKRRLRNSYNSDRTWLEVAMSGEVHEDRDAFAEADDFDGLWDRARDGRAQVVESEGEKSLLASLDGLHCSQTERLHKWRNFQAQVSRRNGDLVVIRSPTSSPRKIPRRQLQNSPGKTHYRKLSDTHAATFTLPPSQRRSTSPHKAPNMWSTPKGDSHKTEVSRTPSHSIGRVLFAEVSDTEGDGAAPCQLLPTATIETASQRRLKQSSSSQDDDSSHYRPPTQSRAVRASEAPMLSLAQRTRNSMAFTTARHSRQSRDDRTGSDIVKREETALENEIGAITQETSQVSLAERAQQSMAQIQRSTSTKTPVRTASHRRSKSHQLARKPAFPVNPFGDSPVKQLSGLGNANLDDMSILDSPREQDSTQNHRSIDDAGEQNAANIFKPRNRLRTSPPGGSPAAPAAKDILG